MKFLKTYIGRFIVFFLILLIPVGTIGYMYYNSRVQRYLITIKKEQEKEIELRIGRVVDYFRFVNSELKTITNQKQMRDFFSGNRREQESARNNLEDHFLNLMHFSKLYDQIRVLDVHGMEIIRLNYENDAPLIVSTEDYQFKGNRPFFKESIKLNSGDVYLSEFDLNQENEQIQYPIKPVLRVATPITLGGNAKKGVLVFNLLGETFLESLRYVGQEQGWETYMLNDSGNYLIGPDPKKEWSFQMNTAPSYLFADEFPKINAVMRSADKATVSTPDGLFSFCMISAYNFEKASMGLSHFKETWYVVSHLPAEKLRKGISELFEFKDYVLLVFGLLFVILLSALFSNVITKRRLYEEKLLATGHDLRVANRMKDKFISILAHDLKNPLASVTGFVDILKDDFIHMSEESRTKMISAMENSTKILIRLIDDVLMWAQNQNNSAMNDPEIIFLNKIFEDALRFSQLQATRKEVKLIPELDEEIFAMADPQMIETVLRNLLSNAIKFSQRNSTIELGARMYNETHVLVYVTDHGIGLAEKSRKKLFSLDGFQTTPGTENEKGTGMGLIICKDFVERNSGSIWVDSELNKGTTFNFTLLAYHE